MSNAKMSTIKLQGNADYAKVTERLKAFHSGNSNGSIVTTHEFTFSPPGDTYLTFRTVVTPDVSNEDRIFTGHSLGIPKKEAKAFEKLETISIGRALAAAGYLADGEIASFDEMERHLQQDKIKSIEKEWIGEDKPIDWEYAEAKVKTLQWHPDDVRDHFLVSKANYDHFMRLWEDAKRDVGDRV